MAVGESQTQKHRCRMPSFSSSLLDSIYHPVDQPHDHHRRNAAPHDEIDSLRRAIMIEKWMEKYSSAASPHLPSNSDSSTPRPQSKRTKEPVSPGGRIASILNSIFSPRKENISPDWSSVRKSRSMRDTTRRSCFINTGTTSSSSSSSSSRNNKSKRSVRFNINIHDQHSYGREVCGVGSRYIKKNIDSIRLYEKEKERDFDDKSCASSDLFELDNIGKYEAELPVSLKLILCLT